MEPVYAEVLLRPAVIEDFHRDGKRNYGMPFWIAGSDGALKPFILTEAAPAKELMQLIEQGRLFVIQQTSFYNTHPYVRNH